MKLNQPIKHGFVEADHPIQRQFTSSSAPSPRGRSVVTGALALVLMLTAGRVTAATSTIFADDFESYTAVATSMADTADANPTGSQWVISDDTALGETTPGAGVQVINWLTNATGETTQSLFLRSGTKADIQLNGPKSGTRYQLDFWAYVIKEPSSDRGFYIQIQGEGNDYNGSDFVAYQADRAANSKAVRYYDGINTPAAWKNIGTFETNVWQHHRLVMYPNTGEMKVYIDDMENPLNSGDTWLSRSIVAVPTRISIIHEGNSADDGWWAVDNIVFTVDDAISLDTTITEGFESYAARTNPDDDVDPAGAWITTEFDGSGDRSIPAMPGKVQIVDSSVVTPHSGSKSLKLEGGQRAGATLAWGEPPQSDVQVTWWARVPAAVQNLPTDDAVYLRMSLYGKEGANSRAGDCMLLGYGIRVQNGTNVGNGMKLMYYTTAWVESEVTYTPDVWEEYRVITHTSSGKYTVIKNPNSPNPQVVVDRAPFISGSPSVQPVFMAAWSSSNGSGHPPVYVDDIEVKSLVSIADPLPTPYTPTLHGDRFTNYTMLRVPGSVGKAVVAPDNSTILFAMDAPPPDGGIYRAVKVASGNWAVDSTPIVTGIDRPSGLVVDAAGTLWWTHDYAQSLRRLKAPWATSTWEEVVSNFGYTDGDDDPIDLCIAPAGFSGMLGSPGQIVIADRGSDDNPNNAVYLLDPATTTLGQTNLVLGSPAPTADWWKFLIDQTATGLGGDNLNGIAPLAQSGEVVTLSTDGYISAINGDGSYRTIFPATLWQDFWTGGPAPNGIALAVDPADGRIWVGDDTRDQVWSIASNSGNDASAPDQLELSFPLTNPGRPDLQLQMHDPTMAFAGNGAFMVLTDGSVLNDGGRLIIFHNEPIATLDISITQATRQGDGFHLTWESAGAATYEVWRSTDLSDPNGFVNISGDLSGTSYVDANPPAGAAFYRIRVK